MKIRTFEIERWLNPRDGVKYNLGASCVKALTVKELLDIAGQDPDAFFDEVNNMSLHYGHFDGLLRLRKAIAKMYRDVTPDMVLTVHGGTSANCMVIEELVEPGDNVVALVPNYQMHYSIPESLGAEVRLLPLRLENDYLPDMEELAKLVDERTKLITLSNPNNPTGAWMDGPTLQKLVDIARPHGTYILSDEIYRGLREEYMPSMVDLYERGIVTSSTSKVFSMAGTRLGWIVARDRATWDRLENRRSYVTICEGVFDELITAIAFENYEKILQRSREVVGKSRALVEEWLPTQPMLHTSTAGCGTTFFVTYDYDVDCVDLCTELYEERQLLLCHGMCFDVPKSFRLGYSFGKPDILEAGLDILGEGLKKYA